MDNTCKMEGIEAPVTGIFRLPGEPAIVINGLPAAPSACNVSSDTKAHEKATGFGEWLVGREVVKSFGGQFYTGKVTEFDEEVGWYRVVYEDGDSEDLEWCELEEVLRPLDIMVPLKSIAAKITRRMQKSEQKPTTKPGTRTIKQGARNMPG